MSDDSQVIIKRVKKVKGHAHHGGAWKIAYADFVTAMMAFFLLMWLLTVTTEEQRRGISDYFDNPLRVSALGGQAVGEQTRPLPGGGEDLSMTDGEVRRGDPIPLDQETMRRDQELAELEELKAAIEGAIESTPSLGRFRDQLLLDLTDEGLRIQIVDLEDAAMFEIGSAQLQPHASVILSELTPLLNEVGNTISISGHTDAAPFAGGELGYSNWELSNDRANAARRQLVRSGMNPDKVLRILGLASTALLNADDPLDSMNRRIAITVMKRDAEEAVMREQSGAPSVPHPSEQATAE